MPGRPGLGNLILPDGRTPLMVRNAADYITKLPNALPEQAIVALTLCSRGGNALLARIGIMKALNRDVVPAFNPDAKQTVGQCSIRFQRPRQSSSRWLVADHWARLSFRLPQWCWPIRCHLQSSAVSVPSLTCSASIQVNERLSLRRQ